MAGDDNDTMPELEDPNERGGGGDADGMDAESGEAASREDEENELSEEDNRKARDGTGF